ncbi:hypothetical protein WICPIJ_007605 [Wickerhamomyces pijperi]|uniref:Iron transporter FTH1 n=1 Tax=Wickerhamomyces pijperi TaxID=599730 RepID=A0A9P8PZM6_WICPI|nr:hypothetical protein WICPIJ_007605 [Wickerhamomyces pijperi]
MISFESVFSFQIYFILLRETLEIIIIVSILLAFLKQSLILHHGETTIPTQQAQNSTTEEPRTAEETDLLLESMPTSEFGDDEELQLTSTGMKLHQQFKVQILSGSLLGLLISSMIGGSFILIFYHIGTDLWSLSEHYYEGILSLVASLMISAMGLFFLRISKLREKFRVKLGTILLNHGSISKGAGLKDRSRLFLQRYSLFFLPFVTVLRESLEAFVFVGGIGISQPLSTIPLSFILALLTSSIVGYYLYRSSNSLSLKIFLISTTCLLYLISSGLFSKGVWQLELQRYIDLCNGQDMSEVGSGPGSYDIGNSVWHVNCCNGETDGIWMLFTAILGWTNSATYGSVISYNLYWISMIGLLKMLKFQEQEGYLPYVPIKWQLKKLSKKYDLLMKNKKLQVRANLSHGIDNVIPTHLINQNVQIE